MDQIPAYFMPFYIPGVTAPEDWLVVKLPDGRPVYVESKFTKQRS